MSSVFKLPDRAQIEALTSRADKRTVTPLADREVAQRAAKPPAAFTPAEKSLIRKVAGYMPAAQLLEILNERLEADGAGAAPHTMEQLHAEIGTAAAAPGAQDWSSLRKLVAKARRDGVLELVTRQLIDDFAVVYSLTPGQVLRLQDVLLRGQESDE